MIDPENGPNDVAAHYENLLADVYCWLAGGFELAAEANAAFFRRHEIAPRSSGIAVDLGAGPGFQSIPLARAGFEVTAIDLSEKLLDELKRHAAEPGIRAVRDDLLNFRAHLDGPAELIVCMGDTLPHLESVDDVERLFAMTYGALEERGRLILSFRDLTFELEGDERFIAVRSDDERIFTCFLDYKPERVRVHDLVYERADRGWRLRASSYYKLRLGERQIARMLLAAGFEILFSENDGGIVRLIARK